MGQQNFWVGAHCSAGHGLLQDEALVRCGKDAHVDNVVHRRLFWDKVTVATAEELGRDKTFEI
jgi:hypothetical protein